MEFFKALGIIFFIILIMLGLIIGVGFISNILGYTSPFYKRLGNIVEGYQSYISDISSNISNGHSYFEKLDDWNKIQQKRHPPVLKQQGQHTPAPVTPAPVTQTPAQLQKKPTGTANNSSGNSSNTPKPNKFYGGTCSQCSSGGDGMSTSPLTYSLSSFL